MLGLQWGDLVRCTGCLWGNMSTWSRQEEFLTDREVQPQPRVLEGPRLEEGRQLTAESSKKNRRQGRKNWSSKHPSSAGWQGHCRRCGGYENVRFQKSSSKEGAASVGCPGAPCGLAEDCFHMPLSAWTWEGGDRRKGGRGCLRSWEVDAGLGRGSVLRGFSGCSPTYSMYHQ